ncbi:MAG TPA: rhomboid family intramembrane serine protease [Spirochaetota bacterium]|nr:rhomboid family intramembrane serine protease [Spirochaetota bacterium]
MQNSRYSSTGSRVTALILINVIIFFFQSSTKDVFVPYTIPDLGSNQLPYATYWFGLTPYLVVTKYCVWQFFTYMFLHGDFMHIFFNMYALLLFGIPVEQLWGPKKFLFYYFFTGIGAGITIFVMNILLGGIGHYIPTIGASGAVFGLLLAFGMLFPDTELLVFFFIPMRAKYLVVLYGGLELYMQISSGGQSSVSHLGHLGGLAFGLIYFFVSRRRGIEFKAKKIKAVLQTELSKRKENMTDHSSDQDLILLRILQKLETGGASSITDDEYQYIKRMDIFMDHNDELCIDPDFNVDDDYCRKCDNYQACLMRRIRKHL